MILLKTDNQSIRLILTRN